MAFSNVSTSKGTQDMAQFILRSCAIRSQLVQRTNSGKYVRKYISKYCVFAKKHVINVSQIKIVKDREPSSGRLKKNNSSCCAVDISEKRRIHSTQVLTIKTEPPCKKIKVNPVIISEVEVPLSPSEINSLVLSNKPCIALGDLTSHNYGNYPTIKTSHLNTNFSRCISPTIEKYREGIHEASQALLKKDSTVRSKPRGYQSVKTLRHKDSSSQLQKTWRQTSCISLRPQKKYRHHSSLQVSHHSSVLPTQRIGRKNYYVFTFPKPPTGPCLASLFHQLTPRKGHYLQLLVELNTQMKDPLWTTLLQAALHDSFVRDLCIAIGRMYSKPNFGATGHNSTRQNLWDVSKAVAIVNQYIKAGGQILRNMVKFLLRKLENDSIEGRWGKRYRHKKLTKAPYNPLGCGIRFHDDTIMKMSYS
ncbi:hypothetical protein OnM2_045062 [Erysiphe neolycopersici]|uniref:Uncharacterized protein n=1 Tax=Erysiphe neolycopersici TaxID=212602 RepID=A0A420HUN6_9PEZI|nr:hypothetical protein OnM2_045062 [Erysiphe neolycopersici]